MRKLFVGLVIVLCMAVPLVAFAATSDAPAAQSFRSFCGIGPINLTDQQKADLLDSFKKMAEVKKEAINQAVQNGTITKAQGDAAINRIDEMVKYREENGFVGGPGMKRGFGGGQGMGRGFGGGPGQSRNCGGYGCPYNSNVSN